MTSGRLAFAPRISRAYSLYIHQSCRRFSVQSVANGEVGEVSGTPEEHLRRKVLIYRPSKTATQQGSSKTEVWKIRFDSTQKWENPLMGWTSSGDPLSHVGDSALNFDGKASAVEFAKKHGWEYTVQEPHVAIKKPKAYADNFKWKGPE